MNLKLVTTSSHLYGIFGEYYPLSGGDRICVTLEHAYAEGSIFVPKLARGKMYTCKRGVWTLESGRVVKTFQVMDVPDFQGAKVTDLLAGHPGNWNSSSKGCVCLGTDVNLGMKMILESDAAFDKFTELQKDVDTFELLVT
jgi:hypothetical protein